MIDLRQALTVVVVAAIGIGVWCAAHFLAHLPTEATSPIMGLTIALVVGWMQSFRPPEVSQDILADKVTARKQGGA